MSDPWAVVLLVGIATMGLKAAGPLVLGGKSLPPRVMGAVAALAPALLAALVVTQVFDGGQRIVFDERLVAIAVAGALLAARLPILVAVIAAAAVTALLRAL
ncbi:MAG: AzlD domain-containing protein [Dehalococcoidia bacterium]|nr:AzlD domain-containing protein [Dehalococcoidia bacterium]